MRQKLRDYGEKDLEDSRELTGHEAANKWPGQPRMSRSQGHLLRYDFYRLSNPKKYIFSRYET